MAALVPFIFDTPGVAGLNKQGRTAILGQEWATKAVDLVIDSEGRLAHRLGTKAYNTNAGDAAAAIETQFVGTNNSATKTYYCADENGDLYELNGSSVWTDKTDAGLTNQSNGNWKLQNFNGKVVAWHADGEEAVQASVAADFVAISAASGSVPAGDDVLSAFGRLWVIDGQTLYYCALLDETHWTTGAGSFNLQYSWPAGQDIAVAVAEFNGYLVVFGEHSTIIYDNPDDVASMTKVESLEGVGCANRDTVKNVGKDILFLSRSGLKSLSRVIQEKSMPVADVAPQMRDYIVAELASSTAHKITSAYSEKYSLYVLCLQDTTIVVDTRIQMENGAYRVTEWTDFSGAAEDDDGGLLLAVDERAYKYQGVKDLVESDGSNGQTLVGDFESGWIDFGEEVRARDKFLKHFKASVVGGGSASLLFKWYFDYSESAATVSAQIAAPPTAAQYGVAQYGVDTFGTDVDVTELKRAGKKGGRVMKFGFATANSTTALSINSIVLQAKVGKIAI